MRVLFVLVFSIGFVGVSYAQTACPAGVAPGSPQCGPDSGTSRGDVPLPPPRPTGEWIKTWGAIVNAEDSSEAWASIGKLSKDAAEADAIDQCQVAGFHGCAVTFTYKNQCVALASPSSTQGRAGVAAAQNLVLAENDAMEVCREKGGSACSVIYKDCTKPIFRKF
ncbi:DUF4189 domain-containing protein [Xanthomonas campestris pv. raphani]|uniref:DUF4189 domain-containing protein n=1 Tax=Xanthomonas campestris TaxID=339 RepID=UPI000E32A1FF|nr:DUF4189 domain-containing protein [Xanthomonas campestris]MEA9749425.1 DUF4189 domain-containing protein [Xanthomonas campestris pv. raphani]MEA9842328.1 DUF4189 domain-containing protein [Xanthomonas campestris pv. raphani]MEA9931420.1 DUF4189 domain-containing protein [Xanthomonas campestris pv. raphani]RFF69042.1 DUF4189 domain-containing protein [Xanthomonas campestris pv. raphani]WDK30210.1 DUF4189 domain-containing protein [Xanthomonas campestris]